MTDEIKHRPLSRRHHVVPAFYLDRFANEGLLGSLDLKTGKVIAAGPRDLAVVKNFYMIRDSEGNEYDLWEHDFLANSIEGPAAIPLAKAAAGDDLEGEEREALARFVAIQSVRGQAFPTAVERGVVQAAELQLRVARAFLDRGQEVAGIRESISEAYNELYGREPTEEEYAQEVADFGNLDGMKIEVNREWMLRHYMGAGMRLSMVLTTFDWQIIRFDDPVLITSDEPVWLEAPAGGGPYGVGFFTAEAIWMPLDPTAAVRMRQSTFDPVDPGSIDPAWLNQELAQRAHRFLYGNEAALSSLSLP